MSLSQKSTRVHVKKTCDVLIVGAGVAGIAAAITSARQGARVIIADRLVNLGGLATTGLINLFEPMCDGRGNKVYGTLCNIMLESAISIGFDTIPEQWKTDEKPSEKEPRYTSRFSPQIAALSWAELLRKERVEIMLDVHATDVIMEENKCCGVVFSGREGLFTINASVIIDCTGDATLFFLAGLKVRTGQNFFTYICHGISLDSCKRAVEKNNIYYALERVRAGSATMTGLNQPEGRRLYSGTDTEDVTEYILDNQKILLEKLRQNGRLDRDVITLPYIPQFRETRCIEGDSVFSDENPYSFVPDSIAVITDNTRRGSVYEVSAGCLFQSEISNMLTAGRSASAEGVGWDILRTIPSSIATGQAAGVMACIASQKEIDVRMAVKPAQNKLSNMGEFIHIPDDVKN